MIEYIAVILAVALGLMNWRKNVWKQRYQIKSKYLDGIHEAIARNLGRSDVWPKPGYDTIYRRLTELGKTEWPDELTEK